MVVDNKFRKYLNEELTKAKGILNQFKINLEENPTHALEWSNEVFEATAKVEILTEVLNKLTDVHSWVKIKEGLVANVMKNCIQSSTSSLTSHQLRLAKNKVMAELFFK